MFHWVEIGTENNRTRYEFLQKFLADHSFENLVEFIKTPTVDAPKAIEEAMKKYDGIRLGRGCGEVVFSMFNRFPFIVERIRSSDAIVKKGSDWWPEVNAVEGFRRVLVRNGQYLDLDGAALVVGAGAAARVAVTALFMVGFRQFGISSLDVKKVETMVAELRKTHMGAEFKIIPKESLILLPGIYNTMVNTTPMNEDNPMMVELNYFNFFKAGGVAVDFSITPVETSFLKGAHEIGAQRVYGYQVSAQTDMIWAEQIMGKPLTNTLEYEDQLGKMIRTAGV